MRLFMVQMPALNTPQFDWCKTKLPRHPQPVPPIYQPEVGAEAVYWAAHHNRREVYVGLSTLQAVIGNMVIPGLLDFYLARTGYKGQQTAQPVSPDRPDNLWEPVAGDHGPHGIFDDKARTASPELWLAMHERELALGALGVGVAGAATALLRRALR